MVWPKGRPRPKAQRPVLTERDLIAMKEAGDAVSNIFGRAYKHNGWGKAKVREVIFGSAR